MPGRATFLGGLLRTNRRYGRLQLKPLEYERRCISSLYVPARTTLPGSLLGHRFGGEDLSSGEPAARFMGYRREGGRA